MFIKMAEKTDMKVLLDMVKRLITEQTNFVGHYDIARERKFFDDSIDLEDDIVFLATDNGAIVGMVTVRYASNEYSVQILGLYVYEHARRQGWGRLLVDVAEDWAKQRARLQSVITIMYPLDDGVHEFWRKMGYRFYLTTDDELQHYYFKNFYGDRQDD